jgi:hypothetical protein
MGRIYIVVWHKTRASASPTGFFLSIFLPRPDSHLSICLPRHRKVLENMESK